MVFWVEWCCTCVGSKLCWAAPGWCFLCTTCTLSCTSYWCCLLVHVVSIFLSYVLMFAHYFSKDSHLSFLLCVLQLALITWNCKSCRKDCSHVWHYCQTCHKHHMKCVTLLTGKWLRSVKSVDLTKSCIAKYICMYNIIRHWVCPATLLWLQGMTAPRIAHALWVSSCSVKV